MDAQTATTLARKALAFHKAHYAGSDYHLTPGFACAEILQDAGHHDFSSYSLVGTLPTLEDMRRAIRAATSKLATSHIYRC